MRHANITRSFVVIFESRMWELFLVTLWNEFYLMKFWLVMTDGIVSQFYCC
ncbi:hypothetical protein Fmac_008471 [Flemingia macrophylla]|uniref:Uncharacterized protein n=1 Tax=Flemingia macrophylla TaxID=520843 RepID=A0ABD1MY10_9FABA